MKKKNLRFEKFSKLTDIQKMAITFMIGIFLTVGCITLYKTFAIYKEEKTFEVIEGTIPNFTKKDKDLEIAIMVDGENRTEIPEGRDYRVNVECDDENLTGSWDYNTWKLKIEGSFTTATICNIEFNTIEAKYNIKVDGVEQETFPEKGEYKVEISCDNATNYSFDEELWKPVVSGYSQEKETTCNITFNSLHTLYANVEVGDYIAYTPEKTSYTITSEMTGYYTSKTINPSKTKLWRVIRKNNDTTIDVVSEYVVGYFVGFGGKVGYKKYVETLNTIAKQYETEGITSGSRHVGYDGEQSECDTFDSCQNEKTDFPNDLSDLLLIEKSMGTKLAYLEETNPNIFSYWVAARVKMSSYYYAPYVTSNGYVSGYSLVNIYGGESSEGTNSCRPIVILRKGLTATESEKNGKKLWIVN